MNSFVEGVFGVVLIAVIFVFGFLILEALPDNPVKADAQKGLQNLFSGVQLAYDIADALNPLEHPLMWVVYLVVGGLVGFLDAWRR